MIIRPAVADDAEVMSILARYEDVEEVKAVSGTGVYDAVMTGIEMGGARAVHAESGLLCVFGVSTMSALNGVGIPWMISSKVMVNHQFEFARSSKLYFDHLTQGYDLLFNYVDDRYTASKRWLRWLGFHLGPPEPYGVAEMPFRRFHWTREQGKCVIPQSI